MWDSRFIETPHLSRCPKQDAKGNTVDPSARVSSRRYTFVGVSSSTQHRPTLRDQRYQVQRNHSHASLALGLMIYLQWPSSSNWAIGTLVGVSLIVSGVTRLMLSLAVRKAAADLASLSPGKAA